MVAGRKKKVELAEPTYEEPEEVERSRDEWVAMSLPEFIAEASLNEYSAPWHLGEYLDLMSVLHGGKLRICVSCPPQHGKTTLVLYAIVWTLLSNPQLRFAYASHGQLFSDEQSRIMRELYIQCAGKGSIKADFNTIKQWKTNEGGGLISVSHESSLIGRRVDVLVCDDLIKDSDMAESPEQREHVWRWLHGVAMQRLWVGGSIIVIGSRWHFDDPSGRLIAKGFRELNMMAIREDEHGIEHALWPDVKPISWLDTLRSPNSIDFIGLHEWNAAYQGKPIPRTGAMFGPPRYVDAIPDGAHVVGIGVDIATSANSNADFSTAVVLWELDCVYYVGDVRRVQQSMTEVKAMLRDVQTTYPGARMVTYTSGPEKGVLNLLFDDGIPIERLPARHSKWTRSQRCALAWKTGRIVVLSGQRWSTKFAREVEFFTGNEGAIDDQVDALVSIFDLLEASGPVAWASGGFSFGSPCM